MKLQHQILLQVLTVLISGLIIVVVVSAVMITSGSDTWMDQTTVKMKTEELSNIRRIAQTKASYLEELFQQMGNDLDNMGKMIVALDDDSIMDAADYTGLTDAAMYNLISNVDTYQSCSSPERAAVNGDSSPSLAKTSLTNSDGTKRGDFFLRSGWYLPVHNGGKEGTSSDSSTGQTCRVDSVSAAVKTNIQQQFRLNYIWEEMFKNNDAYDALYFGFEDTGLFQQFPWASKTGYLNAGSAKFNCENFDSNVQQSSLGFKNYDPRCRGWYLKAVQYDRLTFTAPYFDANTNALLITAALPVKAANGDLLGVAAIDFKIDTLQQQVISTKILQTGYAFALVTDWSSGASIGAQVAQLDDGQAALHKGVIWSESPTTEQRLVWNIEYPDGSQSQRDAFKNGVPYKNIKDHVKKCIDNNKDVAACNSDTPSAENTLTYQKKDTTWYISYAAVPIAQYAIGVVVPIVDIERASTEVKDDITSKVGWTIGLMVAITIAVGVAIFFFTTVFSAKVTKPVRELKLLCDNITEGKLDGDLESDAKQQGSCLEVTMLHETFKSLMTAVRFGSDAYLNKDINKALKCFQEAEQMFVKLGNGKGIGVSRNNLGAVYLKTEEYALSKQKYEQALQQADEAIMSADEASKDKFRKTKADRMGNLAAVYTEQFRDSKKADNKNELTADAKTLCQDARKLLMDALRIDRETRNMLGFSIRSCALGQLLFEMDDHENAVKALDQAKELIKGVNQHDAKAEPNSPVSQIEVSVAKMHIEANLGLVRKQSDKPQEAMAHWSNALSQAPVLPNEIHQICLSNMHELLKMYGLNQKAGEVQEVIKENLGGLAGGSSGPKDISFVIDYSGSMAGSRMRVVLENVHKVFETYVFGEDHCSLIYFNNAVHTAFELLPKQQHEQMMRSKINQLTRPNMTTALYDAVARAVDQLETSPNRQNKQFIIALTDGDDNSSRVVNQQSLKTKVSNSCCDGLFVISVGTGIASVNFLRELAACTSEGIYVAADQLDELEAAFAQVARSIMGNIVLESY